MYSARSIFFQAAVEEETSVDLMAVIEVCVPCTREQDILCRHLGVNGYNPRSYKEIAEDYDDHYGNVLGVIDKNIKCIRQHAITHNLDICALLPAETNLHPKNQQEKNSYLIGLIDSAIDGLGDYRRERNRQIVITRLGFFGEGIPNDYKNIADFSYVSCGHATAIVGECLKKIKDVLDKQGYGLTLDDLMFSAPKPDFYAQPKNYLEWVVRKVSYGLNEGLKRRNADIVYRRLGLMDYKPQSYPKIGKKHSCDTKTVSTVYDNMRENVQSYLEQDGHGCTLEDMISLISKPPPTLDPEKSPEDFLIWVIRGVVNARTPEKTQRNQDVLFRFWGLNGYGRQLGPQIKEECGLTEATLRGIIHQGRRKVVAYLEKEGYGHVTLGSRGSDFRLVLMPLSLGV